MSKIFFTLLISVLSLGTTLAASPAVAAFFDDSDAFFKRYVQGNGVDYATLKNSNDLTPLLETVATTNLDELQGNEQKAFLINAYNLLVIKQAVENYPLTSVLNVTGFFDGKKQLIGGKRMTLNQLEKELLLKVYDDARLHFVLVCGALGCPPITSFAYRPDQLEEQLDQQTRLALNNPNFIRVDADNQTVGLSQIFEWYAGDFGGSKSNVLAFINQYRQNEIPSNYRSNYYTYDWSLNQISTVTAAPGQTESTGGIVPSGGNNSARYVVSSSIPQGTFEIKIFNNLYSQEAGGERASFFTTSTSVLYGLTDRVNVGFDLRYRQVRYDEAGTANNFDVFSSNGAQAFRRGVTGFGPKVRIAPFNSLPNFSVQSALWLPIADDLSGAENDQRFIEFDGPIWFTQFFNDFSVGNNFSIFTEIDVLIEDIGNRDAGRLNRFSTPVTGIVSYFPNPKTTLYGLASYSPFWQSDFDYFYQLGGGAKYQFTPKFELEVLLTAFDNQFLSSVNGNAGTVNLGLRFNL